MIYVGIDVAKHSHVAAAISQSGKILIPPFSFSSDLAGFSLLLERLSLLDKDRLVIGMESTSHYGENLISFLKAHRFVVVLINPLQTASLRKSTIRKTKTDKVDAKVIAKALILNGYFPLTYSDSNIAMLRSLCNTRQDIVKRRTRAKIQLVAFVDRQFPELHSLFRSGIHIKTSYHLLKRSASPSGIARMHTAALGKFMRKVSCGHFCEQDAVRLKQMAMVSVGQDNPVLDLQIKQTIAQIELFDSQLAQVTPSIEFLMAQIDSVILSIPGIGVVLPAMILSVIGDIHRFSSPAKLLAFAGLDPAVIESGKFVASSTRMSKRGNSMLRYALIQAAFHVSHKSVTFADYYAKKRAEGKNHYSALGHTAKKLLRVIYFMLTRNVRFDLP